MNTERDELAFELFNGDNYHQPREVNAADWAESDASDAQRCNIMFYKIMATAALKAGYRKQAPSECQYEYPATYSDPGYYCEDDADGAYCPRHDPEPASLYGHTNPGPARLNAWAQRQENNK